MWGLVSFINMIVSIWNVSAISCLCNVENKMYEILNSLVHASLKVENETDTPLSLMDKRPKDRIHVIFVIDDNVTIGIFFYVF